jgi:alpha-L-glutamate ligase-like protein
MIFRRFLSLRKAEVLGMNRRNTHYIMQYNPRGSFPLVDDKLLTKQLALKCGIPTPPLYYVVSHHGDIARLDKALIDKQEFVLKPARGSGGSGIILITDRRDGKFMTQSGKMISRDVIAYHISDILSGIYSLEGVEDKAVVEGLIHPDQVFGKVTYEGVPDVRIIVYRGVPTMAMVRLPTRQSDGKANLHRGAVGVGIDIGRGKTLDGARRSEAITHHPDTGELLRDIEIPFWEKMLLMAAQCTDMTGLGYMGVDLVIDKNNGPLLLELNARPGLQIQVANRKGLLERLEMIDRAPKEILISPEKRVAWALQSFAEPGAGAARPKKIEMEILGVESFEVSELAAAAVTRSPTKVVNGDIIVGSTPDNA